MTARGSICMDDIWETTTFKIKNCVQGFDVDHVKAGGVKMLCRECGIVVRESWSMAISLRIVNIA